MDLAQEPLRLGQRLQHVVAQRPVDGPVDQRQRTGEVGTQHPEPAARALRPEPRGHPERVLGDVHPDDQAAALTGEQGLQRDPGAAAQVHHPVPGRHVQQLGQAPMPGLGGRIQGRLVPQRRGHRRDPPSHLVTDPAALVARGRA
jgi:hypothetical protein